MMNWKGSVKKGVQSIRQSMTQMRYEPGGSQIQTQSNVTTVTLHVTRLWIVFACYKELSWIHLEKTKKFPSKQCSPPNTAIMPTSVTISVHTSNGEYMLLVSSNTFLSNIYICNTTIKLFESSIPSMYYLTHNFPQPLVSEVLGQEKFELRWHLVVLALKLSHSSLALKYGGWRGWRDSPSQIQVCLCVCVLLDDCLFSNWKPWFPFNPAPALYGHTGTYFLSIPQGRGCQPDFLWRAPT